MLRGPLTNTLFSVARLAQLVRIAAHPGGCRSPAERLTRIAYVCSHAHDVFVYVRARVHSCKPYNYTHIYVPFHPTSAYTQTYTCIHMRALIHTSVYKYIYTYGVHLHVLTCMPAYTCTFIL